MAFPNSVDAFKTVSGSDPTNLSDAGHDLLSARLNQHSTSIVNTQTYLLANGRGLANVGTDSGSANAYVVNLPTAPSSLLSGMELYLIPSNSNTAASTINVNSIGAVPIVNPAGLALQGGEISRIGIFLIFDGTNFRIVGSCYLGVNISPTTNVQTVNCAGYSEVFVNSNWSGTPPGLTISLNNLSVGTRVIIIAINSTGSSKTFQMGGCTNADGSAFSTVLSLLSGSLNGTSPFENLVSPGITITNAQSVMLIGQVLTTGVLRFSR